MSTYTQIVYHIVFSPKNHNPVISPDNETTLYRIITGIIHGCKSTLYRINGMPDHIYILSSLHPSISLADFVKTIKLSSLEAIKNEKLFPEFDHWQTAYAAFTVSYIRKDAVIEYIRNQKEHHRHMSIGDEVRKLLNEAGVHFEDKYLFE